MSGRLLIAALTLHLTVAIVVAIGAGAAPAFVFLTGVAYLFAFNVVDAIPFLMIPAMVAGALSVIAIGRTRHSSR